MQMFFLIYPYPGQDLEPDPETLDVSQDCTAGGTPVHQRHAHTYSMSNLELLIHPLICN